MCICSVAQFLKRFHSNITLYEISVDGVLLAQTLEFQTASVNNPHSFPDLNQVVIIFAPLSVNSHILRPLSVGNTLNDPLVPEKRKNEGSFRRDYFS